MIFIYFNSCLPNRLQLNPWSTATVLASTNWNTRKTIFTLFNSYLPKRLQLIMDSTATGLTSTNWTKLNSFQFISISACQNGCSWSWVQLQPVWQARIDIYWKIDNQNVTFFNSCLPNRLQLVKICKIKTFEVLPNILIKKTFEDLANKLSVFCTDPEKLCRKNPAF